MSEVKLIKTYSVVAAPGFEPTGGIYFMRFIRGSLHDLHPAGYHLSVNKSRFYQWKTTGANVRNVVIAQQEGSRTHIESLTRVLSSFFSAQ